jgi:DNA-binding NarL/FixJ family response regulator
MPKALTRQIRELGARARVDLEPVPSDEHPGEREPATPGTSTCLTARERQVLELLAKGLTTGGSPTACSSPRRRWAST